MIRVSTFPIACKGTLNLGYMAYALRSEMMKTYLELSPQIWGRSWAAELKKQRQKHSFRYGDQA